MQYYSFLFISDFNTLTAALCSRPSGTSGVFIDHCCRCGSLPIFAGSWSCRIQQLNHKKLVSYTWHPAFYCITSNKPWSHIRSSASDGLLWLCDGYFLVVLRNRKKVKNRYSDFVMSLAWLVWVVDENLITHCRWWMCGWPVAMHRAWFHWSLLCWIDGLSGSCCEGIVLTNRAKRKELLNINLLICFQGACSWRGQWTERLHVDLRHRVPPGGSLLWLFPCLFLSVELMSRCGRQGGQGLKGDRIVWSRESDLSRLIPCGHGCCQGSNTDFDHLRSLVLQPISTRVLWEDLY